VRLAPALQHVALVRRSTTERPTLVWDSYAGDARVADL
jgi:hypothetical protein